MVSYKCHPRLKPTNQRWFHGYISGANVEKFMLDKGVYGSFLVRESQSSVGDYSLAVRTRDEITQTDKISHVQIKCLHNKYDVGGGRQFNSLDELVDHYRRHPMVDTAGTVLNMKYPFNSTRFVAIDIAHRVKELSKLNDQNGHKEGFWEEFEQLQQQECRMLHDRRAGQELRNINKNRYKNILPYDYSRVILTRPTTSSHETSKQLLSQQQHQFSLTKPFSSQGNVSGDNEESDYINANFIRMNPDGKVPSRNQKNITYNKTYIATQGPLPNTINDFWWMVWQEKSDTIVMVTREVERGKNKCSKYWPAINMQIQYGLVQVKNLNEHYEKEYYYREFSVTHDSLTRRVSQWHYLAWPDLNIPTDPKDILNFNERMNQSADPKTPVIVHCSAGIGRSGAFIVIDLIIDQLKNEGLDHNIDIQRIVQNARAQRSGLVQTEAQYKFVYLAVESYIKNTMMQDIQ